MLLFYLQNKRGFDLHMMANSKYASTRETTNLARVARIILGPCTDVLRAVLQKEISSSNLKQKVKTYLAKLPKSPITKQQQRIIHRGNYSDFDITLLYFLLRHIHIVRELIKEGLMSIDTMERKHH